MVTRCKWKTVIHTVVSQFILARNMQILNNMYSIANLVQTTQEKISYIHPLPFMTNEN